MKKLAWTLGALVVGTAIAMGQPPEGPRGPGRGGDFRPPPNPVVQALDADGDGVISAEEIKNAATALGKLDTNQDGKLTDEETRPRPPEGDFGGRGRAPEGRGPQDPGARGPAAGEGRGDGGRGQGDRGGVDRAPGRAPQGRGVPEGRPDARGPEGRGPEGRGSDARGPEGPGRGGPPNPERFIEQAMQFDADGDGKLNRDELAKFAQDMAQRGPQGGGRGPGRDERGAAPGGRPEGERSDRPRRPE